MKLVECVGLTKHYPIRSGVFGRTAGFIHAVDGVTFHVNRGETYSLVGESGCGKTTTGRMVIRLEKPTAGTVSLDGEDISALSGRDLVKFRRRMQAVFQDPYSSLNPRMTVGAIVEEGMLLHGIGDSASARREKAKEALALAGMSPDSLDRYPHEFSGGQRQRIGLARALSTAPDFLVADEAVSALDVSIQAQIINLLEDLREKLGIGCLFIAHDLAVVRHLSDRVGVMYLGHLMEEATAADLFREPLHPYTRALLSSIPEPDPEKRGKRRILLSGDVPGSAPPPPGCRFHTRCPEARRQCGEEEIPEFQPAPGRRVRCILYG